MNDRGDPCASAGDETAEQLLARVTAMVPAALDAARGAAGFPGRWKAIAAKLGALPARLSDLSSHPCFARNALCRELVLSVAATLAEASALAEASCRGPGAGKLRTQSAMDALGCKLDAALRDCALLVRTGVLSDAAAALVSSSSSSSSPAPVADVRELLARLQIGHYCNGEAKTRAVDGLLDAMDKDEKSVVSVLGRAHAAALVQLLSASAAATVREKAATVVSRLAESSDGCGAMLVSEGALPPLIRLAGSSAMGREKAALTLQRLSGSHEISIAIAGHGGARTLLEICHCHTDGEHSLHSTVAQSAAAGALRNLSAVPELRRQLAEDGIVRAMIALLGSSGAAQLAKEHAADCLQNLTSDGHGNDSDSFKRAVVSSGGARSLLLYLDAPLPHEAAVTALRNVAGMLSPHAIVSLGVLPRLAHALKAGSPGAQQAAADAISTIIVSGGGNGNGKVISEENSRAIVPPLVRMLEAKSGGAREAAARALAGLACCCGHGVRELRKDEKGVPALVQLLDRSPLNAAAREHAVACLLALSPAKRCRRLMVSHGAIGYLKQKLPEAEAAAGAGKLLERLEERGKLRSLFSSN
ncbi:uncharacterized protein LOC100846680 [Brachypodium distachyon]|uniref:DUF7032 domain-containing protein n=1 Tax=Brachypodium distachyon TaxID=15368 RepID=A0A0Q3HM51_BRADI|nr:uncharacterized protein LOC100846680 [Brachypodium distachyon]KQK23983.1 hypothetical protein BRADI_1g77390v3 [Brachypodium distachyon]|eukprot:XP_003562185.1 uncharacterized protein LOC100846680 [Brachypodium distachyon]